MIMIMLMIIVMAMVIIMVDDLGMGGDTCLHNAVINKHVEIVEVWLWLWLWVF